MADDSAAITNVNTRKEKIPLSIQCPMLNQSNYTVWAMRIENLLRIHKVWEAIDPGSTDLDKNDIARGLLFQSIPKALILQVGKLGSAKTMWEAIRSRHLGADRVKKARLQTLMSEFERIKMKDTDTIDSFAGRISELASKASTLGETIEESKLVKKFLGSLPRTKYIQIIASLEQVLDLEATGFEDIIGRLKAYEERIVDEENQGETQGKLLYANSEQTFTGTRGRGRGRGGRGRGRGRGRGNTQERTNQADQNQAKSS